MLLVTDHINGLALSQGFDFEQTEPGSPSFLDRQALPISEQPDPAEEKRHHYKESPANAKSRGTGVGQRGSLGLDERITGKVHDRQ